MKFFSNISFFTSSRMNDQDQAMSFVNRKDQSVQGDLHHTWHFALRFCIPFLFFLILSSPVFSQSTIFVDVDATGANDGSSWGDAYTTLQDALADPDLEPGDHIWVAEGVYYPDEGEGQTDNDRNAHFQLINGVSLYGGFEGDESHINERNWEAHVAILSGDIDGNDTTTGGIITDTDNINGNNSYSVVEGTHTNMSARLDGFTITGGKADHATLLIRSHGGGIFSSDGRPTVANVILIGNMATNGGGMANHDNSSATLTNVHFINNEATNFGGGMYNIESDPTLTNAIFSENYSQNNGGGLFNHTGSSPDLVNVLFSENEAANQAGAMLNRDSSSPALTNVTIVGNISAAGNIGGIYNGASSETTLDNVIIWENFSAGDSDVLSASINTGNGANPTISNSLIAHSGGSGSWNADIGTDGGGNLDKDPLFLDLADPDGVDDILGTPDDGLTLIYTSPAVNSGNNGAIPGGTNTDLAGNDRIFNGTANPDIVDMGAYEFQNDPFGTPDENNILYVDKNISGGNGIGSSWTHAIPELRDALTWADENWDGDTDGTLQIWVADGIYLPVAVDDLENVTSSEREATFRLVNDVEIYGGFDGGEPDLNDRDWEANLTILSGDIDDNDSFVVDNGLITNVLNIDGDNSYHIVTGSSTDETAVLDGFFITGGLANDDTPGSVHSIGAGMYTEGGSPTLARLHFMGNHAFDLGGGIYNNDGGSPSLTSVSFSANRASNAGGGMYNVTDSNPNMTNVIFTGNEAGDGIFSIEGGEGGGMYNMDSSPTLTNAIFTDNSADDGGAMYNLDGHTILTNGTFADNSADIGGGIYNSNSNPTLTGAIFTGNSAVDGGGMANTGGGGSSPILTNVTFSGNNATDSGGGMIGSNGSNPTLANVIFWGNTAGESGNEMFNTGDSSVIIEFSLYRDRDGESDIVEGGGFTATNSLTDDPLFENPVDPDGDDDIYGTDDDGLSLTPASLAINAGDNSLIPMGFTTDVAGNDRIFDGIPPTDRIDMGAYEFQGEPDNDQTGTDNILFVDQKVSGGDGSGSSWDNAMPELREALSWADDEWDGSNPPLQIWVADGIYHPVSPANPDNPTNSERLSTFRLANRVEIYGGFAGDEENRNERDWETNLTILSGDIDNNDVTDANGVVIDASDVAGENSYHVVIGSNTDESAVLDGFFVTAGLANIRSAGSVRDLGGGLYNQSGNPTLARLHIIGNWAQLGGGMVNRTGASPMLTNVTFTGNRGGERGGGGMYNLGDASPTLINVSFRNNRAQSGGGMRNSQNSNPILINVTFSGNQAGAGGGMYNLDSSPTLINVSFSGNRANSFGGGMFSEIRSNPTLINSIFWNNQADGSTNTFSASIANLSDSNPTISRSLVANCNPGGNWVSHCGIDGGNNFTNMDPMFIKGLNPADAPTLGGDLRLQTSSPVINAGDNTPFESGGVAEGVVTDLAGNPRIFNSMVDMGAYEFQGETQGDLNFTLTMDEGWRMLASPFDGLTYHDMIGKLWTQGFPGSDAPSADFANVYTWPNDIAGNNPADWAALANQTDPVPAGTGFLMQVYADDNFDGTVDGEEEFDKTIQLSGDLRTGEISLPSMNSTTDGWTLVGNPYITSIDFETLMTSSSGLTEVGYIWDRNYTGSDRGPTNGNTGGWRTTDGIYGDIEVGIIAPAQGFFVQNSGSDGELTFTLASQTDDDGNFYGKKKELRDFVRLEVRGEAGVNSAWIRFSKEGSGEQIYGDALELQPYTEHYALWGTRKTGGTMLDIAHFPLPDEKTRIPLSVETTLSGTYHITATKLDLPAGIPLYLHDRQTGESVLIDEGLEYSFVITEAQESKKQLSSAQAPKGQASRSTVAGGPKKATIASTDRFLITTTPELPTTEIPEKVALGQNYPNPFNPSTIINYQLPASSQVRLEVYDMIGRRVATLVDGQVAAGTHQVNFNAGGLSSGMYLYRLQTDRKIITKKLTLIK